MVDCECTGDTDKFQNTRVGFCTENVLLISKKQFTLQRQNESESELVGEGLKIIGIGSFPSGSARLVFS